MYIQFPTDACASYQVGWKSPHPWAPNGQFGRRARDEEQTPIHSDSAVWREGEQIPPPHVLEPPSPLQVSLGLPNKQQILMRLERGQCQAEQM